MQIIRGSLAGVVLAGLVGTHAFATPSQPSEASAAAGRTTMASRIRAGLANQRTGLAAQRTSLDTTTLSGVCTGRRVFKAEAVQRAYQSIRSDALAQFSAPDAAPAKALLESKFPQLPQATSSGCPGAAPHYTETQVIQLWGQISEWFKLAESSSILMDVAVRSTPDHAEASLKPADGTKKYGPKWTDCKFPQLFRGTYRVSVKKEGYKTFDDELPLSESKSPEIQCDLIKSSETGESRCALK